MIKLITIVLVAITVHGGAIAGPVAPEKYDENKSGILDTKEEINNFIAAGNKELDRQKKLKARIKSKDSIFKSTKYTIGLKFDEEGAVDKEKYSAEIGLKLWERKVCPDGRSAKASGSKLCGFAATAGLDFSLERTRDFQETEQQEVDRITIFPIKLDYKFAEDPISFFQRVKPFVRLGYGWSETDKLVAGEPRSRESDDEFSWEFGVEFPLENGSNGVWGLKLSQKVIFDGFVSGKKADTLDIGLSREWKAQ